MMMATCCGVRSDGALCGEQAGPGGMWCPACDPLGEPDPQAAPGPPETEPLASSPASSGSAPGPGRCEALNRRGEPCQCPPRRGQKRCPWHQRTRETDQLRKLGGRRSRRTLPPDLLPGDLPSLRTVAAVQSLLERTVAEVSLLSNSEGRARTIGALAALLLKSIETGELETLRCELDAVKSQIAQERDPWRTTH